MKEFKCRKCGNKTYKHRHYKIKHQDYHRKLFHQNPAAFNRYDRKVVCRKCGHAQRE